MKIKIKIKNINKKTIRKMDSDLLDLLYDEILEIEDKIEDEMYRRAKANQVYYLDQEIEKLNN